MIVDHGQVIASGTPDELKSQGGRDVIEVHPHARRPTSTRWPRCWPRSPPSRPAPTATPTASPPRSTAAPTSWPRVVRLLDERQIPVDDIGLRRPTLDEVFLALTGQPIDEPTDPDPAAAAA